MVGTVLGVAVSALAMLRALKAKCVSEKGTSASDSNEK
jgi:hypothetical protein